MDDEHFQGSMSILLFTESAARLTQSTRCNVCLSVSLFMPMWINSFFVEYEFEASRQVCATIVDFLGDIPEETRNRIVGGLYNDMCHLKPFSEKQENQLGAMVQLFAEMKKAVNSSVF